MHDIPPPQHTLERRAPSIHLPSYRFVPGHHPHPLKHPKGHLYGKEADLYALSPKMRWNIGVDLFNNHYFWEAHEIWEGLWKERSGSERDFLQAMILLSAALLQEHLAREDIAEKTIRKAENRLKNAHAWSIHYQVNIERLLGDFYARRNAERYPKIIRPD